MSIESAKPRLKTHGRPCSKRRWRFTLVKPEEFTVRGSNYVATMATDMTFLATGLTPLKEKFGMEFGTGNPFALPCMISSTAAASVSKTVGEGVIAVAGGASAKSQVGRRKESPTRVARRISKVGRLHFHSGRLPSMLRHLSRIATRWFLLGFGQIKTNPFIQIAQAGADHAKHTRQETKSGKLQVQILRCARIHASTICRRVTLDAKNASYSVDLWIPCNVSVHLLRMKKTRA